MGFVANFIRFPAVKNFENRLRFDKVTKFKGGNLFLRHSVCRPTYVCMYLKCNHVITLGFSKHLSSWALNGSCACVSGTAAVVSHWSL